MVRYKHLAIAVPMMAERDNVEALLEALQRQTFRDFSLYCCINQPEPDATASKPAHHSFSQEELLALRSNNQETLQMLQRQTDIPIYIIDRSSPGKGWQGKQQGVGWARKLLFDTIAQKDNSELIVSLDADTGIPDDYLQRVCDVMNHHENAFALAVPYYHPLCGDEATDRAMLRYELYMRHYLLNLLLIQNPYAFTALGSAMVFPLWAYRRVGGITPLPGGEDFYLLQKFAKSGLLLRYVDSCVYPQGRVSHRVPFGTGPAIAQGVTGVRNHYRFFSSSAYQQVEETFRRFPSLYGEDRETPMTPFLHATLKTNDLWAPLRKNFHRRDLFVRACIERVDGLRILQFLRHCEGDNPNEMNAFFDLLERLQLNICKEIDFNNSPITLLNDIRNQLFEKEMELRRNIFSPID